MIATTYFVRVLLIVLFSTAAWSKVSSRQAFDRFEIGLGQVVDTSLRMRRSAAAGVVIAESATLIALLVEPTVGCWCALALLVIFLTAVTRAVVSGKIARCDCFGADGSDLGWSHVIRNALLVLSATAGAIAATLSTRSPILPHGPLAVIAVSAVIAGGLFTRWDDLVYTVTGRAV